MNDTDDDPSDWLATDESGADFEKNFGRVEKGQKVLDVFSVDGVDDAADLLEGAVVDELDDVTNGGDELGNQKRMIGVPEVACNEKMILPLSLQIILQGY